MDDNFRKKLDEKLTEFNEEFGKVFEPNELREIYERLVRRIGELLDEEEKHGKVH